MSYADVAIIKRTVGIRDGDIQDDPMLAIAVDAGKATIDAYCGRSFDAPVTNPTVRYFTADTIGVCVIDDLADTDGLKVEIYDGATWQDVTSTVVVTAAGGFPTDGLPFDELRSDGLWDFPTKYGKVRVTGHWGWLQVPLVVAQAHLLLAVRYFARPNAPFGLIAGSPDTMMTRISTIDPDVKALLSTVRRGDRAGWAL
jgi:hypothetical protein